MLELLLESDPVKESLLEEAEKEKYDLSIFKKFRFNAMQVYEILQGMKSGVDYYSYADPLYDFMDMHECRLELESSREE